MFFVDYSKILKIDENTTIVDVIGIYEVFLKRIGKKKKLKDTDINEINALNIALMMACNFKSDNELINKKNAYLLKNSNTKFDKPDREKCIYGFENFLKLQNNLICEMKKNNISMKQCFGF